MGKEIKIKNMKGFCFKMPYRVWTDSTEWSNTAGAFTHCLKPNIKEATANATGKPWAACDTCWSSTYNSSYSWWSSACSFSSRWKYFTYNSRCGSSWSDPVWLMECQNLRTPGTLDPTNHHQTCFLNLIEVKILNLFVFVLISSPPVWGNMF